MQQPAPQQTSPNPPSFAGLLTALAAPPETSDVWSDGEPGEDVATLSYEHALRTRAHYRPVEDNDGSGWAVKSGGSVVATQAVTTQAPEPADSRNDSEPALANMPPQIALDRNPRPASVTIRLSKEECTRLRQRAAEAGLTVSAYLRSCMFEVDELRTQVKAALAELRACTMQQKPAQRTAARRSRWHWLMRFFPHKKP